MGVLKARVDRLWVTSGAADRINEERHRRRQFREREASLLYFLNAVPGEFGEAVWAAVEPWAGEILNRFYLDADDAPLVARIACGVDWNGWFPSPLPAAWVRAVLDHPTAKKAECGRCGLNHPSGGYTWKDGRPVFAPPHVPHCLHCGEAMGEVSYGKVAQGYHQRHGRRNPYPVLGLGKFLLAGGDPSRFDPLTGGAPAGQTRPPAGSRGRPSPP